MATAVELKTNVRAPAFPPGAEIPRSHEGMLVYLRIFRSGRKQRGSCRRAPSAGGEHAVGDLNARSLSLSRRTAERDVSAADDRWCGASPVLRNAEKSPEAGIERLAGSTSTNCLLDGALAVTFD